MNECINKILHFRNQLKLKKYLVVSFLIIFACIRIIVTVNKIIINKNIYTQTTKNETNNKIKEEKRIIIIIDLTKPKMYAINQATPFFNFKYIIILLFRSVYFL